MSARVEVVTAEDAEAGIRAAVAELAALRPALVEELRNYIWLRYGVTL